MQVVVNNIFLFLNEEETIIGDKISKILNIDKTQIDDYQIIKKSIDARKKDRITMVYSALVTLKQKTFIKYGKDVSKPNFVEDLKIEKIKMKKRPVIVGFGPAGMFLGLYLSRAGAKPIILERGKSIEEREEDIKNFQNKGIFNAKSNICFGEGGAGTYSDGKLSTGIKDPRIRFCLKEFIKHGAPKQIYYESQPHIGSDILKNVVKNIRQEIISLGGEIRFSHQLIDLKIKNNCVHKAVVLDKNAKLYEIETDDLVLAIGHSARDTFKMLYENNLEMKPKPFSMGVRIEHLQSEVNKSQYGKNYDNPKLNAANYKLAIHLNNNRTLYSFCMCPGGVVVGSNTEEHSIVTNGMSYFKRDLENANSALLVNVNVEDYYQNSPLDGIEFQRKYEELAFNQKYPYFAPCQLVKDLLNDIPSKKLGHIKPSYLPGIYLTSLKNVLPQFVYESLKIGIPLLAEKYPFFKDYDALLTGVETRSSSPISIPRNEKGVANIDGIYPCGEGAAYAGGIMSAAIDGLRIADLISAKYQNTK